MIIATGLIEGKLNINTNLNLNSYIKEHHYIIEIKDCHVFGELEYINEQLVANINVETNLVLADHSTFEPVLDNLKFNLELSFGDKDNSDYILEKEINLSEIVYGHILVYKPQAVFTEKQDEEKQVKKVNPAFKELKDWK